MNTTVSRVHVPQRKRGVLKPPEKVKDRQLPPSPPVTPQPADYPRGLAGLTLSEALASLVPEALKVRAARGLSWAGIIVTVLWKESKQQHRIQYSHRLCSFIPGNVL